MKRNQEFFEKNKEKFIKEYNEKYIIIYDEAVVNVFNNIHEAIIYSMNNYKPGDFIIEQCVKKDKKNITYNSRVSFVL